MKKHVRILFCLALCFLAAACQNNDASLEGDAQVYGQTEQEVSRINENCNLLGCVLLGEAPKDAVTAQLEAIRDSGTDYYICFPYREEQKITELHLVSEDASVFGLSTADNIEDAAAIMKDEGYTRQEASPPNTQTFIKYYVTISFPYKDDNRITSIGISVNDPASQAITY